MEPVVAEITSADSPGFAAAMVVRREFDAVDEPDDPPLPEEEWAGELFGPATHEPRRAWVATLGGRPAGVLVAQRLLDGENDGRAILELIVHPDLRRRGVARTLLATGLPELAEDGVDDVLGWPYDDSGNALSARLGLTSRQDERCSRLRIADVDEAQQRSWIHDAPGPAKGYRLVQWQGVCPDEHLTPFRQASDALADAPLDDMELATPPLTDEQVREREEGWARRTWQASTSLVLAPDGGGAGMTQLFVAPGRPQFGHQGDTGVVAAHRGHALGRWLKAANLAQARAAHPELAVVQTYNAQSNPWMLAINVEMGFRPHRTFATYQGSLAGVVAALRPSRAATDAAI
ncbi:MAG TPA: GNAT family N-acetyltransferase [Acidimicrobiales bacterium]|nr:GNAT family N-acetyltransferase [Acidimicrobiales bacterium]